MVRICFKWFVKFLKMWRRCALAADQIPLLAVTFTFYNQVVYCFPLKENDNASMIQVSYKHNMW